MRKSILLLMALCLHLAARGQTGYEYDYWFDNNRQTLQSGSSESGSWQLQTDISGLSETLHAIHLQVRDKDGNQSSPVTRYFVKTILKGAGNGRYWFDDAVDKMYTSSQVQGLMDIDVSQLAEGFHSIHYQVIGANGNISTTATRSFYKTYMPSGSSWRCWFDNDYATLKAGTDMSQTLLLDVSELADGYHVMHIQVDGGAQSASTPITKPFIKVPQTIGVEEYTCLCMVDDQLHKQEKVPAGKGVVQWNFDVSSLPQGFHRIFVQIVTPSGAASNTWQSFFLRETTRAEFAQMKCVYAIDGAEFYTEAGTLGDGTYHFDLDVSSLDNGLHRIAYMLSNGLGVTTKTQCQFFVKTPLGGNGITEYWYWLNDQAASNAKKVALPERKDPFSLITLLPVESQPLRSSSFQFRVVQNQPVIYAKNDIHIRFYDVAGRFTDVSEQFVDENVKEEVTDVEWLESGVRATTAKPAENTIKWYCLDAEPGDSLQFVLNRAATIQLFAPSGKEVYSASGAESVKWGGLHVFETGTYYLALHDVTATYGNDISIDYNHIDKYAVLRQDVAVVGNGGPSTITFEGNGFNELTSVDLIMNSVVLHSTEIGHESDSQTGVTFDFTNVALGQYQAVFHFGDENISRDKCVKVEEATDNILDATLNFASRYLLGTSNTFTVNLKNQGNMTAYETPVLVYIFVPDESSLSTIEISGYDVRKSFKDILGADYTQQVADSINQIAQNFGDLYYFVHDSNSEYIDGFPHMYCAALSPNLRPNKTEELKISIKASTPIQLHAWCPDEWYSKEKANDSQQTSITRRAKENGCSPFYLLKAQECIDRIEKNQVLHYANSDIDCDHLPPDCYHILGTATPVQSLDPNDIYGYAAESGSKAVKEGITEVYYRIEFENDPKFATASAHNIYVSDTLDAQKFDLSTFAPTRINIGDKTAELSGDKNFVTTVDMRPEINAIAQVTGTYDQTKGIAKWHITSLDPMTMEPTNDPMDGVLPVNANGNGIGEVSYDIKLKNGLAHGTEIKNRAGIVFDTNEKIMTPYWTNVIDRIAPESHVTDVQMLNDTTAAVSIQASDELSGPWRYDVYVQYGTGSAWVKGAENVPIDTTASVRVYEGINHGFYVVVTDSAGNVEQKDAEREYTFEVFGSQVETHTQLQLAEGWNWISHNQNDPLALDGLKAKALRIMSQTEELYKDARVGWSGDLEELLPTQMYKVQMAEADNVQLSGYLFNAGFRSIPLYEGWNWLGYPVANAMTVAEALEKFEAEEGDFIIGQDGMATYSGGQWTGTLTEFQPGKGYMYRSASDKNLFYNATAQTSSHAVARRAAKENWTVDSRKYPNVMGLVGDLVQNGFTADADEWLVAAFCGDECRGVAQTVDGVLMMNIYGTGSELINFYAMNRNTEELLMATETEKFRVDVLGSMQQPYQLHIGETTGIKDVNNELLMDGNGVYDLQGRQISGKLSSINARLKKGIYIVTDSKRTKTQKVVR